CLLTLSPSGSCRSVRLAVMLDDAVQINDPSRWAEVPYTLMQAMNPETGLLPMLATPVDVGLAKAAYLASEDLGAFGISTKQGAINLSSGAEFLVRLVDIESGERSE